MARKNGKGKDDDFDQGGPDGPARLEREGERGKGDNKRFDGKALADMLETIAAAEARIQKRNEETSKKNQPDRDEIKQARADMVESGCPSIELAALIRKHKLQRKLDSVDAKLDPDQKETFAEMVEALGGLADMPLGEAAKARHPDAHAN
jgi:formate dehydrogenase maturation protein FdhE